MQETKTRSEENKAESTQATQNCVEPIFNFSCQTVGWLENETLYSNDSLPIACVHQGDIFAVRNGLHLGRLDAGVLRDSLGYMVAFITDSWCFTTLTPPDTELTAGIQPLLVVCCAPVLATPPPPAPPLYHLSSLDWERFMLGCKAHSLGKQAEAEQG